MNRKITSIIALVVGIILGYALRWVEVDKSNHKNLEKSISYVTSKEGSEFFDSLKALGIARESLRMSISESSLQIVVEVPDASVDATVEALKTVAPSYPITLEVKSERGSVLFLPNGVVDFRDILERLNQAAPKKSEQDVPPNP